MLRVTPIERRPGQVMLKLEGRVCLESAGVLAQVVHASLGGAQTVVLDLDGVTFIDAAGLALLEGWRGTRLRWCGGAPFIQLLLHSHGIAAMPCGAAEGGR